MNSDHKIRGINSSDTSQVIREDSFIICIMIINSFNLKLATKSSLARSAN